MRKDGIRYPSMNQLVDKVGSKYKLVIGLQRSGISISWSWSKWTYTCLITKPRNVKF